MLHPNIPMYLRDLTFSTEKVDGEVRRIVVAQVRIAPFTAAMAEEMGPGVRERLFRRTDATPVEDVAEIKFRLSSTLQELRVKLAPDATRESVIIPNVRVDSELRVRRDKETPTFEATLKLDFAYPSPDDLLFLANQVNEQIIVTLSDQQQNMLDEQRSPEDAAKPRLGRKARNKAADAAEDAAAGVAVGEFAEERAAAVNAE